MPQEIMRLEALVDIVDLNMRVSCTDCNEPGTRIEAYFKAHLVGCLKASDSFFDRFQFKQGLQKVNSDHEGLVGRTDILMVRGDSETNHFFVVLRQGVLVNPTLVIEDRYFAIIKCESSRSVDRERTTSVKRW
jgi:hypothetical protein